MQNTNIKFWLCCKRWIPGGKDGTIRAVFEGVNPAGVKVAKF